MEEYCQLIVHENGIHELILLSGTKRGVDCYMEKIGTLFEALPPHETLLYMLNGTQSKLPPIQYFVNRSNQFERDHPEIGNGRLAILYKRDVFISVAATVIRMLNNLYRGRLVMELFEETERDSAIEWLLKGKQ